MAKHIHQGEIDDCPVEKVKSVSLQTEFRDLSNTDWVHTVLSARINGAGGGRGGGGKNYMRNANINNNGEWSKQTRKRHSNSSPYSIRDIPFSCFLFFPTYPTQRIPDLVQIYHEQIWSVVRDNVLRKENQKNRICLTSGFSPRNEKESHKQENKGTKNFL